MPTYTVLGGTGSTGSAVIRTLTASPPTGLSLRLFVRSKAKLLELLPELSMRSDTTIIEGSLADPHTLAECLSGSDAIFSCIATNDSAPGTSIALDTAAAIIAASRRLRDAQAEKYVKPVVLMLSSASMNESLQGKPPKAITAVINRALWYIYQDLRRAESLYRDCHADDADLLDAIFVQPPAIMPGTVATGHEISTERGEGIVSFADLGAGMVEIMGRRGELEWKGVSVLATGKVESDWGPNLKTLVTGLVAYCLPGLWSLGRRWRIW